MKVLYAAIDQVVPGTRGGSVHVTAVAEGLAALGHEVHVLATPGDGPFPAGPVRWIPMSPPFGAQQLRWARAGGVKRIAQRLRPDVVMERYYNFGGEAILHARELNARAVLEVNAPVIDHPGSTKALIDRALLVRPMQRWRERLCEAADIIVTPSAAILPPGTARAKVRELEWGADTVRFHPGAEGPLPFTPPGGTVAVFAGAFRSWHGAIHFVRAIRLLRERGCHDIGGLFIGDGPELPAVRAEASGLDNVIFAGAVPHERMPAALASAHIGVAPFDLGAHKPLSLGFYWSPLKVFEYMAAGLPVVAPAVGRIPQLVGDGREGILYDPAGVPPEGGNHRRPGVPLEGGNHRRPGVPPEGGNYRRPGVPPEGGNYRRPGVPREGGNYRGGGHAVALADALERLTDVDLRTRLGAAARERAEREYSWAAHCRALSDAFK